MTTTTDEQRCVIARRVAAALASSREARRALVGIADTAGETPIIVAAREDEMSYVFDRLRNDYPNGAYVATLGPRNKLSFISMRPVRGSRANRDECAIGPGSSVGMLLDLLRKVEGPIECHEVRDVQFALVGIGN